MSEKELQKAVIDLAHRFGWLVAHFDRSPTASGKWATAVRADAAGFPDLVLVRGDQQVVFAELKQDAKYPNPKQRKWINALKQSGSRVYIWRPEDWHDGLIEAVLR